MQDDPPIHKDVAEQQLSGMLDATDSRAAAQQMPHPEAANKPNAGHVNPMHQLASHAEASSRCASSQERLPEDGPSCSHHHDGSDYTGEQLLQHSRAETSEDAANTQLPMNARQDDFQQNAALMDAGRHASSRQGVPLPNTFVRSAEQPSHASTLQLHQMHEANLDQHYEQQVVGSQPEDPALTRQAHRLLPQPAVQVRSNRPAAVQQPQPAAVQDCPEGIPFVADCCVTAVLVPVLMAHTAYGVYKQGRSFLKQVWCGMRWNLKIVIPC